MHSELSPLIVFIALWKMNTCSEFQVNIFSNNRGTSKFWREDDGNDATKAIARPRLFSENSRTKNIYYIWSASNANYAILAHKRKINPIIIMLHNATSMELTRNIDA